MYVEETGAFELYIQPLWEFSKIKTTMMHSFVQSVTSLLNLLKLDSERMQPKSGCLQ